MIASEERFSLSGRRLSRPSFRSQGFRSWTFRPGGASSTAMIRAISLVILCAASFAVVYWATAPGEKERLRLASVESDGASPATVGSINASLTTDETTPPAGDTSAVVLRPTTAPVSNVRNVTPADMTAAPPVTGSLVRVDPPATAPATPQKKRMARVFNPVIVSAGTIKAGNREIHLAGVAATRPDARCGKGSDSWPCGRVARTALRNFIHGRAIECEIPAGVDQIPDPATCFVGGGDIAEWLVAQGWAERTGEAYADAAKTARKGKLGLFAESRPDAQPDELAARP